jgi:hypothetical protein
MTIWRRCPELRASGCRSQESLLRGAAPRVRLRPKAGIGDTAANSTESGNMGMEDPVEIRISLRERL